VQVLTNLHLDSVTALGQSLAACRHNEQNNIGFEMLLSCMLAVAKLIHFF
jgi:hypothetical protein